MLIVLKVIVALFFLPFGSPYSTKLYAGTKECFIVTTVTGIPCTGSFEVISGDPNSLIISVVGPSPRRFLHFESKFKSGVDSEKDLSEGSFSFDADADGDYTFCIESVGKSDDTTVAFNFRAISTGEQDYEYIGLESELAELREGLDLLKDHQSYMSQREDVHKDALESINTKVLCWTILEAVILVGMAIWQISYISSFFETKRRL